MRYNTIVEKSEDGLCEIIRAVEQFEEDRFLAGLQVRRIIERFDELEGVEGSKGKLNGSLLVEFIKWCGVRKDMEKNLYETYFCTTYKGKLKLLTWNTVYKVRRDREAGGITDEEERMAFEKVLAA